MDAGALSERLNFEKRIITRAPDPSVPDEVAWQHDFFEAGDASRSGELSARFVVRYRPNITPATHRVVWDGAIWHIVGIDPDRRRTQLTINCDFSMLVESTDLKSDDREFIPQPPVIRPKP